MKLGLLRRFLIIGAVVGGILPFGLSICLFGTTLQVFLAGPPPDQGFWSGAPTPVATAVPSAVHVFTNTALTSTGGVVFVLWSMLGAFAGEAVAMRMGKEWDSNRNAALGAIVGSAIFIGLSLCGLLR